MEIVKRLTSRPRNGSETGLRTLKPYAEHKECEDRFRESADQKEVKE